MVVVMLSQNLWLYDVYMYCTCSVTCTHCEWQDLKDFMRQAGEVTYADAHKEHKNEGSVICRLF